MMVIVWLLMQNRRLVKRYKEYDRYEEGYWILADSLVQTGLEYDFEKDKIRLFGDKRGEIDIPEIVDAGIDSLKVEGRMKTALYVATVARTYRKAIDDFFTSPECYKENLEYYRQEIAKCTYRQFTTGFFFDKPKDDAQIYDNNVYVKEYTYLGIVNRVMPDGYIALEQRNKFSVGDEVELMKKNGENINVVVLGMKDEEGNPMESCPHPKQKVFVKFSVLPEEFDIIRQKEEE